MRVLVTGSSGLLGDTIADELLRQNEVLGIDMKPGRFTNRIGSITDRRLIFDLVSGVNAVIHTASLHAPHVEEFTKEEFIDVNIKGTLNLLEAAREYRLHKFVYTSTTSLYGFAMVPNHSAVWVDEQLDPKPRDIYDITKLAAEQLCQDFALRLGLPVICLRTSRFWNEPEYLKAVYRLYRGVDVRDAAAAHVLALNNTSIQYEVLNISAQSPFTKNELEELLGNANRVIVRHFPSSESLFRQRGWDLPATIDRVYDISKAQARLGYRPKFNFEEMMAWVNTNGEE